MAALAIVFALLNFDVYLVCFSKYLSDRDKGAFLDIFEQLGLSKIIVYGTFCELAELMINKDGNVREMA